MAVIRSRSNEVRKKELRAKEDKLELIRDYAINNDFRIGELYNQSKSIKEISQYLVKVYYMGTENNKGNIIPITCSMNKIIELEHFIKNWVENNGN